LASIDITTGSSGGSFFGPVGTLPMAAELFFATALECISVSKQFRIRAKLKFSVERKDRINLQGNVTFESQRESKKKKRNKLMLSCNCLEVLGVKEISLSVVLLFPSLLYFLQRR
jgi:hypothetical protein